MGIHPRSLSLALAIGLIACGTRDTSDVSGFAGDEAYEGGEGAPAPPPVDVTPIEPRFITPTEGRPAELVDALVTVDDAIVGLAIVEDRVERFTLDREGARWTERRVLATGRPVGGEHVHAAQPLAGGDFALLLEGREDGLLRVLDTSTGAVRTLPEDMGRVDQAEATGDGFRFLSFRGQAWRVLLDPASEDEVMDLPRHTLPGEYHQESLRNGLLLRVSWRSTHSTRRCA